jgi:hypothetical protein
LLDHVIPLNAEHLRWLGREYLAYYRADRRHLGLEKSTPINARSNTAGSDESGCRSTSNRRPSPPLHLGSCS